MPPTSSTLNTGSGQPATEGRRTGSSAAAAPLIHVGYPKAASSFLQQAVFGAHPGLCEPWPTGDNTVLERICWVREADFDPERVARDFSGAHLAAGADKRPVISHEVLVGNPNQRLFWGDTAAGRLARAFPGARVLILIREQASLGLSTWTEFVRRGGQHGLRQVVGVKGARPPGYRPFLPAEYLRYSPLVALYQDLFGAERVTVLPVEMLRRDPGRFFAQLWSAAEVEPHPVDATDRVYQGLGPTTLKLTRWGNRVSGSGPGEPRNALDTRLIRPLLKLSARAEGKLRPSAKVRMPDDVKAHIRRIVADDNRRLEELTGLDLESLGYALS